MLFPAPAAEAIIISYRKVYSAKYCTDVFHGSIIVSLHQKTSIPHGCHLQPTIFRFRRAEIHAPGYDSSMDPVVIASSGRLAATCCLYVALSVPRLSTQTLVW